jgi:hypothetical protein
MAKTDAPRHQIIRTAILHRPEATARVTAALWNPLATEITSIIGKGGFDSLYSRCIHLVAVKFPWLAASHSSQPFDSRFADLQTILEGRDAGEAGEASISLLITFLDILATLIGESLTSTILRSAWGEDALNIAVKDFDND